MARAQFENCPPLYSGDWGFFCYPTPKGFLLQVPQDIVFATRDAAASRSRRATRSMRPTRSSREAHAPSTRTAEFGYPNRK